ncbi:WXG100 family type VII secretion target [Streptomyces albus subsp. chlorinus]|uniref:WXG100 family type VII secretion target n=1 Tax=Streptomyces albus TaxID=1888 RepID=UPI00156EA519|nr:WXG100 family type VII secretion target [Streptomyces albus]NSC22898.1 WXG100 family type VII secretion target [Streptomyces albus subsp. chlorinus]
MSDDGSNTAGGGGIAPPPMPGLGPPAGSTDGSAPPVPEEWQRQANADQIGDYARTPYPSPPPTEQSTDTGTGGGAPPAGTEGGTGGEGSAPSDYSLAQFHVDLQALSDATTEVGHVSTEIAGYMRTIATLATQLHDHWDGPAYLSFDSVQQWFQRTEKQLHDLLDEIVRRMKISYDNFHQAELVNLANLQGSQQQLAGTPQPPRPREVYVLEHAGADGASAGGGAGSGGGEQGGGVPSLPRKELLVEHVNADGTPVGDAGQGGGDQGGAVPSLPREEWVVEHVNADGTPVGDAGQGGGDQGGAVPSLPRKEWVVEHVNADGTPVGGAGSGGGDQGAAASVAGGAHEEGPRVLLPAPEGVTGPFKPETVPLDEYLSGAGAAGGDASAGAGGDGSGGAVAGGAVPSLPRQEWVVEHVNADGTPVGGAGSGGGDQGAAASVAGGAHEEGPRVLLPAPEGVTGPFKPETVPLDEYLSGAGAAGGDAGGAVPSLPRQEWVVEHVNADGTPVAGPPPGGNGGQG